MMLKQLAKGKELLAAKGPKEAEEAKETEPLWPSPMEMRKTQRRMASKMMRRSGTSAW